MKEGEISSENWMLDEARQTVLSSLEKNLSKEELIKELAIQKIEYGRICVIQVLMQTLGKTTEEVKTYYNEFDAKLRKRIEEIGGETEGFAIITKSEKH